MLLIWALAGSAGARHARAQVGPDTRPRPAIDKQGMDASHGVVAAVMQGEQVILLGPSAEIYDPQGAPEGQFEGAGTWLRRGLGGVAADVRGAAMTPQGQIFVAGSRTPLYAFIQGAWHIRSLPNRGPVALATGKELAAGVGRHVYVWKDQAWQRLAGVPGTITALWAASSNRVYAATRGGMLVRVKGASWTRVRHPLDPGDPITLLAGMPGKKLYALAQSGAVLAVGAASARVLGRDETLALFQPHTAAVDSSGTLWLAGAVPEVAGTPALAPEVAGTPAPEVAGTPAPEVAGTPAPEVAGTPAPEVAGTPAGVRLVLTRVQGNKLVMVEPIPRFDPWDRVTVLVRRKTGDMLVATRGGDLQVRDRAGRWKSGTISTRQAPATQPTMKPARTR